MQGMAKILVMFLRRRLSTLLYLLSESFIHYLTRLNPREIVDPYCVQTSQVHRHGMMMKLLLEGGIFDLCILTYFIYYIEH